jgi:hypothetical protein
MKKSLIVKPVIRKLEYTEAAVFAAASVFKKRELF